MTLLDRLSRRQFLVVTGKGGVGKTLVSALLGRLFAARGRRVLLLEVDPRANLHELAGSAPSGGDVVTVGPRLFLQNLQARQVMEQVVRDHLRVELLVKRVVASPIFKHFVDAAPGLEELAVLGHAWRALHGFGPEASLGADVVILDAPATGHGLALLAAPQVVSAVIKDGPFGHMAGELAGFVGDPERTGVVTVTLAEEMPVQEALELRAALEQRLGRPPDLLVVNGLYPRLPERRRIAPRDGLWARRRAINDRELARLAAAWPGPRVHLPLVPVGRGPALVDALAPVLAGALDAEAAA
jgi:anion-transporting  ArsA/GET3 family ATPase